MRRLAGGLGLIVVILLWLWTGGGLHYMVGWPAALVWLLLLGLPLAGWRMPTLRIALGVIGVLLLVWTAVIWMFFLKPTNLRRWEPWNSLPPLVRANADAGWVRVDNVRHFKWRSREDYDEAWVNATYYLDRLDSLALVVEPLRGSGLFAHTMLSFGFGPEKRVVISIEARRELGERFGLLPGLYKQFEVFYQVNSERDALTRRALDPRSQLYVFPIRATREFIRGLFLEMLDNANRLVDEPRFYHSLRANCTTLLLEHVNRHLEEPVGVTREILFPAKSGELLHRLGWMDTDLDYDGARERFRLVDKVREHAEAGDFSTRIRE